MSIKLQFFHSECAKLKKHFGSMDINFVSIQGSGVVRKGGFANILYGKIKVGNFRLFFKNNSRLKNSWVKGGPSGYVPDSRLLCDLLFPFWVVRRIFYFVISFLELLTFKNASSVLFRRTKGIFTEQFVRLNILWDLLFLPFLCSRS